MTPKLEDRVVYFIHKTLEKAEKDNFGGFLYEKNRNFSAFSKLKTSSQIGFNSSSRKFLQKLNFWTKIQDLEQCAVRMHL